MDTVNVDLNDINLDKSFDEDDPDTIILIRLSAWHIRFERINASSVASQLMVGLVRVRRWEKRNSTDFYWVTLLMHTIWEYWNLCDTWCSSKIFVNSSILFFSDFGTNISKQILENI